MVSSGVFANAVINIVGNVGGFRGVMREVQTQLWGMMTLANRVGGAFTQNIVSPIVAYRGMVNAQNSQQAAQLFYSRSMANWRAQEPLRPVGPRPPANFMGPPSQAMLNQIQAWQSYDQARQNWMGLKPSKGHIFNSFMQNAALAEAKWLALGTAIGAVVTTLVQAAKYASDFTEQLNMMVGLFGRSSDAMMSHVGDMARMGIGKSEYMANLSTLGVELMGSGVAEGLATKMATEMGARAIDTASWYNISSNDKAFQKFTSGLAGFGRPLKELGIIINETRVETYALTHGLWDGRSALTESIKVQARYGLIMQETARATGDYSRTLGGYANQWRAFQGNWENFMTNIGKAMEPLIALGLRIVNDFLVTFNTVTEFSLKIRDSIYNWIFGIDEEARKLEVSRQNRMMTDRQYADEIIADQKLASRSRNVASHTTLDGFAKRLQEGIFNDHGRMLVDLTRVLVGLTKEQIAELKKLYPKIKAYTEQNAPAGAWN